MSPGPCPVRAMRAEGRERESHVSLRQPCCAVDPYVPTPVSVSITGREGGRGSAQRGVGGEEGGWCQAQPTLAKVRGHQALTAIPSTTPRLDRPGTGVILVSFLPLVGCVPFREGTSQATRGVTQLLRVGLRLVIGLVKEGQIFFNPSLRELVCEN